MRTQLPSCGASIEGRGRSIGAPRHAAEAAVTLEGGKRDVFVGPSWYAMRHDAADEDCVLLSFSDWPVQQALGLFREVRGNG